MKKDRRKYKALAVAQIGLEIAALNVKSKATKDLGESLALFHKTTALVIQGKAIASTPTHLFNSKGKIDKRRRTRLNRKHKTTIISTPIQPIDSDWILNVLNKDNDNNFIEIA